MQEIQSPKPVMQPEMSFSRKNEIPIDSKLYKAVVDGRFEEFESFEDSLDRLVNSKQDTILHIHLNWSDERSAEFVQKVFDKCPQLLTQANENGDTPLHVAARNDHSEMVRLLIQLAKTRDIESGEEAVADARQMIRMVNKYKDTALHEAVRWDNDDVVTEILDAEDLEYKYGVNSSGETPLYLAACSRSDFSVRVILRAYKHKPVAYQGPNGKTVLHAAILYCSGLEDLITFKIIESMGSLVNEADENGWTPLHYAVCFPGSEVVSKILEKDTSSAYMKDNDRKRTPLHLAACLGNLDAVRTNTSICFDCAELTDYRGWNVCHFAAISKSSQALQLIWEDCSLDHLFTCRDANGYFPFELYFLATYNTSSHRWKMDMFPYLYCKVRTDEILAKKVEIDEWTKDLGHGPLRKIEAGALAPEEKSPEERRKEEEEKMRQKQEKSPEQKRIEMEEKIIPELEKAKESHLVAAALVATVTFAAAFTLPGGYVSDSDNANNLKLGSPILSRNAAFKAFVITDGLALVLSTCSVFIHFIMVMLGYKQKYYWLMGSAFWFIIMAMGAMVVAFVTGTYAVLAPDSFVLALLTCLIGLTFFLYMFYAGIRVEFYRSAGTPDYPYPGWCKPLLFIFGWLILPAVGLGYIIIVALEWIEKRRQQHRLNFIRN